MSDDLVKAARASYAPPDHVDGESLRRLLRVLSDMVEAQVARIAELEAALRVYECSGKCANCYGAVQNTKYCGQIARAALAGGKNE